MLKTLLAQEKIGGEITGIGPLGPPGGLTQETAAGLFAKVLSSVIGLMTVIAGIWFIFLFMSGAISWLTAGGDKARVQEAQKKITSGIIGLVIVIAGIFIIDLFGTIIGLDILNPVKFITDFWV